MELGLDFRFYNNRRPHQVLGYRTPAQVFHGDLSAPVEEPKVMQDAPVPVLASLAGAAGLSLNSPLILS